MRRHPTPYFFLLPALIVTTVLIVLPMIYTFWLSLNVNNPLTSSYGFVGLDNFVEVFQDPYFYITLGNTLYYTAINIPIELIIGVGLALAINNLKGERFYRTVLILPVLLSPIIVGLIWKWMFNANYGVFNEILKLVGVQGPNWLTNPSVVRIGIITASIWYTLPFTVLVTLASLKTISKTLYEAAKLDGANTVRRFFHITLPSLKNITFIVILFRSMDLIKIFDLVWVMTKGGPGYASESLGTLTYRTAFQYWQLGRAASISYIIFFLSLIISLILIRHILKSGAD